MRRSRRARRRPLGTLLLVIAALAPAACDKGASKPETGASGSGASERAAHSADVPALRPVDAFIAEQEKSGRIDRANPRWKISLPEPPAVTFASGERWFWNLRTNKGDMRVRLWPDVAPKHVAACAYLTRLGFYDGTKFHRVMPGFMAQGGSPDGSPSGSPGYRFGGEVRADVRFDREGLLGAANTGAPNTDGSQFFLTLVPTPHLNGKHTIYGEVVEGMETLRTLERLGSSSGATTEPLVLEQATITVEGT